MVTQPPFGVVYFSLFFNKRTKVTNPNEEIKMKNVILAVVLLGMSSVSQATEYKESGYVCRLDTTCKPGDIWLVSTKIKRNIEGIVRLCVHGSIKQLTPTVATCIVKFASYNKRHVRK